MFCLIGWAFLLVRITFMQMPGNVHDMSLEQVRSEISRVDAGIIRLIAERQELADRVAHIKTKNGIAIHDEKRTAEVLSSVFDQAVERKIDPVAVRKVFEILISMSEERQKEFTDEENLL